MRVYSGKQYGNNFNSGDEGLFQDANRPRDNDKFKIRPGLQSDKWKQREVNKEITTVASQLIAANRVYNVSSAGIMPDECTIPTLIEVSKEGNPGCIVNKDGNIEIVEDGTYIIQALTQFIPPTVPSSSYNYIEKVCLLKHKTGNYTGFEWSMKTLSQTRMCGYGDEVTVLWTGWFKKGDILNVGAIHTYTSAIELLQRMNIHRLA